MKPLRYLPNDEPAYVECSHCGNTDISENMYRSRLISGIFCESCMNAIIKEEEEEYPNDPGNHKKESFYHA